jgi:hypothetical protein
MKCLSDSWQVTLTGRFDYSLLVSQFQKKRMCPLVDQIVTDGGGVRGLSSLMILQRIMGELNDMRAPDEVLEPWQVFDMIGGTSTGG